MQPTAKPMKILMFFINGEPKSSVIIMVIKERKPRPMNSADPQLEIGSQ
jgi:hypothetical protein